MAKRRRKGNSLFWVFLALIFVVSTGVIATLFFFDQEQTDSRGCLAGTPKTTTELSILIDATEPLRNSQLENVSSLVQRKVAGLEPYDRVRIFTISPPDGQLLKPSFDLCKPNPDSVDSSIKKRFEELRFRDEIEKQLRNNSGVQPFSPIIFSLGSVASQFKSEQAEREIILISDLIQNSEMLEILFSNFSQL